MRRSCASLGALFLIACIASHADTITTTYNYTGALQYFTAPVTGSYQIAAFGAAGGNTLYTDPFYPTGVYPGAKGAAVSGLLNLSSGETLTLLVGGQGGDLTLANTTSARGGGGGGGGSFVATSTRQPLAVAGGGGAKPSCGNGGGCPGSAETSGTPGSALGLHNLMPGDGGVAGSGGGAATLFGDVVGGGGGGFFSDGIGGPSAGQGFLNGGAGGLGLFVNSPGANGGYGGGSGSSSFLPGAGGGYSGGGGSGGGGGSYLDASALNPLRIAGENSGNGRIVIAEENAPAPVPEPSSLVLLATGLLGAAGTLKRKAN